MATQDDQQNNLLGRLIAADNTTKDSSYLSALSQISTIVESVGIGKVGEGTPVKPSGREIDSPASLGKFIAERRKTKGISQDTLSDLAGISLGTIKGIEAGRNVGLHSVFVVLNTLGMKPCMK